MKPVACHLSYPEAVSSAKFRHENTRSLQVYAEFLLYSNAVFSWLAKKKSVRFEATGFSRCRQVRAVRKEIYMTISPERKKA